MLEIVNEIAKQKNLADFSVIRCDRSGVFYGKVLSLEYQTAIVVSCRRIYWWEGAASCTQLALDGTSEPAKCLFPAVEPIKLVTDVIEIIPMTKKALESLNSVAVWKA